MRTSPLIEYSSTVLLLCLWLGAITTVFSSLVGLFQQDIKKVIAYSTMSQLGMMVIAVGLSSYNVALFHLINHAFASKIIYSCTILNNNTYLTRELFLVWKRLEFLVSNIWHLILFHPSPCYCSHRYVGFNYRFLYSGINKITFFESLKIIPLLHTHYFAEDKQSLLHFVTMSIMNFMIDFRGFQMLRVLLYLG